MQNEEQDPALQTPSEANRDKHMNHLAAEDNDTHEENDESIETRRRRHDADSGSDGTSDAILQKENLIDPGNEHHHGSDTHDKVFDKDNERSSRHDADAGGDSSGSTGPEPGEGKNDAPDTSGEDG